MKLKVFQKYSKLIIFPAGISLIKSCWTHRKIYWNWKGPTMKKENFENLYNIDLKKYIEKVNKSIMIMLSNIYNKL